MAEAEAVEALAQRNVEAWEAQVAGAELDRADNTRALLLAFSTELEARHRIDRQVTVREAGERAVEECNALKQELDTYRTGELRERELCLQLQLRGPAARLQHPATSDDGGRADGAGQVRRLHQSSLAPIAH